MAKTQSFLKELGYPVEKPDGASEELYGGVWVAAQAQRQVSKALKPFGLTPVKLNYLMIVKHIGREEGLSQREIARRLLIDAGNVTHVLDALEKKGWVVRDAGPDRRSHRIKITEKGSKLLSEVWPIYKRAVSRLTAGLSAEGQRRMVEALSGWRESLEV